MNSVFASLNQGESVTKGLKKVDKSEMTHKNPELRASSVVAATIRALRLPRSSQIQAGSSCVRMCSGVWEGTDEASEAPLVPEEAAKDAARGQEVVDRAPLFSSPDANSCSQAS